MILNAILGGFLGRLGGKAGLNTKLRDFGVPLFFALSLRATPLWIILISAFILFVLVTEGYGEHSPLFKIFGKYTFAALGFIYSLAALPVTIHHHILAAQVLFSLLCAASIWAIHEYREKLYPFFIGDQADFEEFFRYFIIVLLAGVLI